MSAGYSIGSVQDPLRGGIEHQGNGYLNQIWNVSQLILLNCWGRSSGSDQSGLSFDVFVFARQIGK